MQRCGAHAVKALMCCGPEFQSAIVSAGAIPHLVKLLGTEDKDMQVGLL